MTSNTLLMLLSLVSVGQTPAPMAALELPTEQIPVSPVSVQSQAAPGPAPETLPAPDAQPDTQKVMSSGLLPLQDLGQRLYGGAEYLHWWFREARVPDLLTTGSPAGGGVLGAPDTQVLFGGDRSAGNTQFNGTRVFIGYWFALGRFGVESDAFFLPSVHSIFTASSNGSTLLALPYTNAVTGAPASTIIAGPTAGGTLSGSFTGYTATQLYGQQLNFVYLLAGDGVGTALQYLGGLRFLEMHDRLYDTVFNGAGVVTSHDDFYAHDTFYGFTYGLRGILNRGPFSLQVRGIGAMGGTDQQLYTSGTPGFYVQPTNSGIFTRTRFDMVYETGINLGWQPTSWLKAYIGYTFLWWVNPIRAGDQVDTTLNFTGAGPARPAVHFQQDSLWAQGLSVGLGVRW